MKTRSQQRVFAQTASDTVLSIPELFEAILSQLPLRTLLTAAQRVSRYWRATITGSLRLQRLLFLQPQPQPQAQDGVFDDRNRVLNPLLAEAFPPWYPPRPESSRYSHTVFGTLPMTRASSNMKAFLRPQASWRLMFISQPPPLKLGCWMSKQFVFGQLPEHQFKIQSFPSGLRMGTLYSRVQRWLGTCPTADFSINHTPKQYDTLHIIHGIQVLPAALVAALPRDVVLERCGMAVDVMLSGQRCDPVGCLQSATEERELATFRRKFKLRGNTASELLEPASDSGYKIPHDWDLEQRALQQS